MKSIQLGIQENSFILDYNLNVIVSDLSILLPFVLKLSKLQIF